jgi:predicted metal-dependent phosphoesterase TrpH
MHRSTGTGTNTGISANSAAFGAGLELRKADLHLHSNVSFDVLNIPEFSPRALYDEAIHRGMGFFALTDHETIRGAECLRRELKAEYGEHPPIPVITGIEIAVRDPDVGHTVHVNVLGLDQGQMLELARRRRSIGRLLEFCREQKLYHQYNHPFWFERGERGSLGAIQRLIREFPVIELNAGRIRSLNDRALRLATLAGKQVVATSDSHTGQVGKAYTMAPGDTPERFLRNIETGLSVAIPHHTSVLDMLSEIETTIEVALGRRGPFRLKPTLLRRQRIARRIADHALQSRILMGHSPLKPAFTRALHVLAFPPVVHFIQKQRQMHAWLSESNA